MRPLTRQASGLFIALSAFLTLAVAQRLDGEPIHLRLVCQNADRCVTKGVVVLRAGHESSSPPVRIAVIDDVAELPSTVRAATWEVALSSEGSWMPAQRIALTPRAPELKVWRTAAVRGRFAQGSPGGDLPKTFKLAIGSPPGARAALPGETALDCPVAADGTWSCNVPAVPVDLVVRAKGFVPHYRWDVSVLADRGASVGTLTLRRASSLVAWLDRSTVAALKGPARARLLRMAMPDSSPATQRLAQPVAEATFNARGAVQLAPAGPGKYTVEIVAAGFAPARLHEIELFQESESVLKRAIRLELPVTLHLRVTPGRTPAGARWQVEIRRFDEFTGRLSRVAGGAADAAGMFIVADQAPGRYRVTVRNATGDDMASRELRIDDDTTHTIVLALTEVRGRVHLAGAPLPARLLFGGRSGSEKIAAEADERGRFEVTLPRRGRWTVDVTSDAEDVVAAVDVLVDDGDVRIELPDTEVSGWVLDPVGGRAANAAITAMTPAGGIHRKVAAAGVFRIRGVAPGSFTISAADPGTGERSGLRELVVQAGVPVRHLQLQLERLEVATGTVFSQGSPVAGARIIAYAAGGGATARRITTVSDVNGRFEVRASGGATELWLIVAAAGRVMQAQRAPLDSRPIRVDLPVGGGTLAVRIPKDAQRPYLTFQGVVMPFPDLREWANAHNTPARQDGAMQVPRLAPGPYRLCAVLPSKTESCRAGTLAPGGTLELLLEN